LVHAKLHNSRVCLHRWQLDTPDEHETLLEQERAVTQAPELDALRGHEGVAAALYFRAIARSLDPAWDFTARQAHPPVGPFNALLSFGYTLLYNLVLGAVRGTGLIAHVGFFHADREGHATLASDLVEPWRAPLVDRTVLAMIRAGDLSPADFHETPDGTRLHDPARRLFLARWERKLDEPVTLPGAIAPTPHRLALLAQVGHLARHLREPDVPYHPFLVS
ncbi:MAG: CRISPR-associated endonuclease Cas1, partial [bacterium]|nr:CRISPR-associated endonuclease Cas1 [bacterium]